MGVLLGQLFGYLTGWFSKAFLTGAFRIAITLSFISLVVAAIYAYVSAAGLIISSLASTVPDIVAGVWGWVMPANTAACLTALMSAVLLRFVTAQYLALFKAKHVAALSKL